MTSIGIVGSEAAKFTAQTEETARKLIRELIAPFDAVVSGACHLGGIDAWAIEEAKLAGKVWREFPALTLSWSFGYKPRNEQIARAADFVACITVKHLPASYKGMRFKLCYHCGTDAHVKSGGCWTVKFGKNEGRGGEVYVVDGDHWTACGGVGKRLAT